MSALSAKITCPMTKSWQWEHIVDRLIKNLSDKATVNNVHISENLTSGSDQTVHWHLYSRYSGLWREKATNDKIFVGGQSGIFPWPEVWDSNPVTAQILYWTCVCCQLLKIQN